MLVIAIHAILKAILCVKYFIIHTNYIKYQVPQVFYISFYVNYFIYQKSLRFLNLYKIFSL